MANAIEATFLQQADDPSRPDQVKAVAEKLAAFIEAAQQSLDIAIYDFRLGPDTAPLVVGALNKQAEAGVHVRLAYFEPKTKRTRTAQFAPYGHDPAPGPDPAFLKTLHQSIQLKGIAEEFDPQKSTAQLDQSIERAAIDGGGHLMHSKYVVRDGLAPDAALWMGSANFTDDAWGRQENNIVTVASQDLCQYYMTDFAELWASDRIAGTGKNDLGTITVEGTPIHVAFAPGEGRTIDTDIAGRIAAARKEILVASMVISSSNILGALVDALDRGVALRGIYDGTEMQGVEHAWEKSNAPTSAGKLKQWETVKAQLASKHSTPYSPTAPHDFMHNKTAVVDGRVVVTGSFNFSLNATGNAENVLVLESETLASQYAAYIDAITKRYAKN